MRFQSLSGFIKYTFVCDDRLYLNYMFSQQRFVCVCECVSLPEVSGLRAQVLVHGIQGTHPTVFLQPDAI